MFSSFKFKLKELNKAPAFFIGSGISMRYIGIPTWIGLLKEVAKDCDRNFKHYYQKHVNDNGICDFESLGSELEIAYFDKLMDAELEENKNIRYYFRKKISDIIKQKLDLNLESISTNREIIELKKTTPSAIITTNYDELLETIFPSYTRYIGQSELLTNTTEGVGDIYKIHGCVTKPESIIINKFDYDNFFKKQIYLNAKLITLFLEYPIVFLGYSLSDRNVKNILTTIVDMLPSNKVKELNSRIWFIRRNENGQDYNRTERIDLSNGRYLDVETFYVTDFSDFYKSVNEVNSNKLPIKFLKYLKSNTYDLIASQEYDSRKLDVNLYDLDKIEDFSERSNFLGLTISAKKEKVFLDRNDICRAFVNDNFNGLNIFSLIDYALKMNEKFPIHRAVSNYDINKIVRYIKKSNFTSTKKEKLIYKLNEDECTNYNLYVGRDLNITFEYKANIDNDNINKYLEHIYEINDVRFQQQNTVRKYFILYLINERIEDILSNSEFLNQNKNYIISVITNLSKEFIKGNKEAIYIIISQLDNGKYSAEFRTMLCYVDTCLYKLEKSNVLKEIALDGE